MASLDERVSIVETHIDHIRSDIADIRAEQRELRGDMRTQFRWIIGLQLTTILAMFGMFFALLNRLH